MSNGTQGGGWIKVALGISVAANLFFVGLMGGSLLDKKPEGRDAPPSGFMTSLDADRKAEVRAFFEQLRADRKESRTATREAWANVRAAMTADPFDRNAMEAAMGDVMEARSARSARRYAKMVDFVTDMTPEERIAFSDAMRKKYERRRARREAGG